MAHIKGIKLVHLHAFVDEQLGPFAWGDLIASLPEDEQLLVDSVDTANWYDAALVARLRTSAWQSLGRGDDRVMRELGRFEARREYASTYPWYLRLSDPWYSVGRMDLYWRRSHDTGIWESGATGDEIVATLSEHESSDPAACLRILGFLDVTLANFGFHARALDHPECRLRGDKTCVFRARLASGPAREQRHFGRVTRTELGRIGHELQHYPTLDGLVHAILTVLRAYLGYDSVSLFCNNAGQGPMAFVCAAGDATGITATRRQILQNAGRVIGRLELGTRRPYHTSAEIHMLEELLPWIASALTNLTRDASEPTHEQMVVLPPGQGLAARLSQMQTRFALTRRQVAVMKYLVCGQSNKNIADALGLKSGTVELHVTQILRKCLASNRAELAARFWSELDDPAAVLIV